MNKQKISVALIEDHTLFRKTLRAYLSSTDEIDVCLESCNWCDPGMQEISHIDVLILDLFTPKSRPIEAVKSIRERYPSVKMIVLSMCSDLQLISELVRFGIYAFIHKSAEPEELIKAIHSAIEGDVYQSKIFTDALYLHEKKTINSYQKQIFSFDDREKKILNLLWQEKSNKEIAAEIYLSIRSVEKIRQDMKDKLGVNSTIGLLKYALENEII